MRSVSIRIFVVAALLVVSATAWAQMPHMQHTANSKLVWNDLVVPGFAPGTKVAAVSGDPSVADQPYTLRLKFPDGYRFPAHFHPRAENLTVLSGSFLLEMGPKETGTFVTYAPGDFIMMPPTVPHSGGAKGETIIQLHGVGPFDIILVNPVK